MEFNNQMIITDENGQEREVEIILTFENDEKTRKFVLFTDPADTDGNVYAYEYNDEGEMNVVTDEADLEMCQEVLGAFMEEDDGSEEEE